MFQETLSPGRMIREDVVNDALGIAFSGFIGYLVVTVAVHQFVPQGCSGDKQSPLYSSGRLSSAAPIYWSIKRLKQPETHFPTFPYLYQRRISS